MLSAWEINCLNCVQYRGCKSIYIYIYGQVQVRLIFEAEFYEQIEPQIRRILGFSDSRSPASDSLLSRFCGSDSRIL